MKPRFKSLHQLDKMLSHEYGQKVMRNRRGKYGMVQKYKEMGPR
jgi:hypothetical protein